MFLACSLKSPHATAPTVETEVFVNELRGKRWERTDWNSHRIAVPPPETWTLDSVRIVLTTLREFLPVHDVAEAEALISLHGRRPVKAATLEVRARGWSAEAYVPSLRNKQDVYRARCERNELNFTEPMIAALGDLQAQSPISLATIAPIDAAITTTPAPLSDDLDLDTMLQQLPAGRRAVVLKAMKTLLKGIVADESSGGGAK